MLGLKGISHLAWPFILLLIMYICVFMCMCVHEGGVTTHQHMCSQKPEWGIGSHGVIVTGRCGWWEPHPGTSAQLLSLQPRYSSWHKNQNHDRCKFMSSSFLRQREVVVRSQCGGGKPTYKNNQQLLAISILPKILIWGTWLTSCFFFF